MNSESEFFASLIEKLKILIDERTPAIVDRLSQVNQQIEIRINVQSLEGDVRVSINTTEKYILPLETAKGGHRQAPPLKGGQRASPHVPVTPSDSVVCSEDTKSNFCADKFKQEFLRIAGYQIHKCKFYSLPIEIAFYLKPNNIVGGRVTSNFVID